MHVNFFTLSMKLFFTFFITIGLFSQTSYKTPFELGNGNQSPTFEEMMAYYAILGKDFDNIKIFEKGTADDGTPMSFVVFDSSKKFDFKSNQLKIFINNNIHPGEPDGVDASMQFLRDLALQTIKADNNLMVVILPAFNLEGMKNRNSFSRANQNGPEAYGFRGNAKNYDLNRDFIKSDTKNMKAFYEIFHLIKPEIFIDNHVSNGADYQYVLTMIQTQHNKLGKPLGDFLNTKMYPAIEKSLNQKNIVVVPYVNVYNKPPEFGFHALLDSPRYSSGFASLFSALAFLPETHMLKPYQERVKVTYEFMLETYFYASKHHAIIKEQVNLNKSQHQPGGLYPLHWQLDSLNYKTINFKGYEASTKKSLVTGQDRLFYDQTKPFEKPVKYYNQYVPKSQVFIPAYYVIPNHEYKVLDLLKHNYINVEVLAHEITQNVEVYYIKDYKTVSSPYEGHYLHFDTQIEKKSETITIPKGWVLVPTNQEGIRYLLETLEPQATDSFFNWNFFDSILQRKEHYSPYVFEDLASELLKNDVILKENFNQKKAADLNFATNAKAQLDFIYQNSNYAESAYMRYPIFRILK